MRMPLKIIVSPTPGSLCFTNIRKPQREMLVQAFRHTRFLSYSWKWGGTLIRSFQLERASRPTPSVILAKPIHDFLTQSSIARSWRQVVLGR
jgi:hypothetical protein